MPCKKKLLQKNAFIKKSNILLVYKEISDTKKIAGNHRRRNYHDKKHLKEQNRFCSIYLSMRGKPEWRSQ